MRTVDLFAGCGGMSMGFQNAGMDVVAAFEYWTSAAKCYQNNFKHPVFELDLSDTEAAVTAILPLMPELIIGGPPCQDFSHAGKRIEAGRASLTGAFSEIIRRVLPRYFVMENVDRAQRSQAYIAARQVFKNAGYGLTEIVLDASKCGVPQKRKRFFCIGAIAQPDNFLRTYIEPADDIAATTIRDYFGETLDFEFYYRHPRNYNRRGIFSIDEPAPTMRGVNRPVPKGYPGHANDACPLNDQLRALTTLERALIQTFPSEYKWTGTKTDIEQMIGNAVPVKLAEYVAYALHAFISDDAKIATNQPLFTEWLVDYKRFSRRSAGDAISRIKRAEKICPLHGTPNAEYNHILENQIEFHNLTPSVKSQIKRAVELYSEYLNVVKSTRLSM